MDKLLAAAFAAMENSYSPYSGYRVGAAVETEDGEIIGGCNIENASYGLTICAERTALFSAYSIGKRKIKRLCVVSDGEDYPYPCGACRQVMTELCADAKIILMNKDGLRKEFTVSELLPHSFSLSHE